MGPGPRLVSGLVTEGHTIEEARKMIRDAVRAYLDRGKRAASRSPWMTTSASASGSRLLLILCKRSARPRRLVAIGEGKLTRGRREAGEVPGKMPTWAPLNLTFAGIWEVQPHWVQERLREVQVIDVRKPENTTGRSVESRARFPFLWGSLQREFRKS